MLKLIGLFSVALAFGAAAQAPAPARPENTGPNASITRWAEGKYVYQTTDGKRQRGWEKFHLNVHPDGTRTLMMWNDIFARNNQYTVTLRADANFRPLQAYISYWTENGFKGSSFIAIDGGRLEAIANGPNGRNTQAIDVPVNVSIGGHPVAGDGWHMWYENPGAKGEQAIGQMYNVESSSDLSRPVLGQMVPMKFENFGKEKITVPAGTFDTVKYKISGTSDAWLLMPDRIMIRVVNPGRGLDYVLTEFRSGDNGKK
jgi:hypothetical protein